MANEFLRDRIARKLATLPDERLYQVLDFVEFLETKYAEPTAATTANLFTRFAEGVEDRLRAGKVSAGTIAETMNLMHRAVKVLDGVATAGTKVATDIADVAKGIVTPPPGSRGTSGASATPESGTASTGAAPVDRPAGTTPPSTGGSQG
jgi:hypothetical protein